MADLDTLAPLRNRLRALSAGVNEYAGLPMPLEGEQLVVEPSYPFAAALSAPAAEQDTDDGYVLRNQFWSHRHRCTIVVMEKDGRVSYGVEPGFHHVKHDLQTLGCSPAWGIEQEHAAQELLGTLLRHHTLKQYLLTGMFLETSQRSGITYLFRRLKPTVAITTRGEDVKILCALCMHPIAYYQGSWAGAMCPTDDVVAHLMLMRGDEAMFWRRCNQHRAHRPEAGL